MRSAVTTLGLWLTGLCLGLPPSLAVASDCTRCWAYFCVSDEPQALVRLRYLDQSEFIVEEEFGHATVRPGDKVKWINGYDKVPGKLFAATIAANSPELLMTPIPLNDDGSHYCGKTDLLLHDIAVAVQSRDCRAKASEMFGSSGCEQSVFGCNTVGNAAKNAGSASVLIFGVAAALWARRRRVSCHD